ncbi:glycosyl transferase [Acidovorax sp. SRB_14]|uniref:glycosyltransferase n=1 Tax=Acidovorax sp. SRB_14 TaxID=1962699 RepID=UPI0015668FE6|nr:glycosyltransferase [Acidovorax sp. SRB_14]NMM81599.1 glycosyl transferase [Acidovorax sp. SRB_14]
MTQKSTCQPSVAVCLAAYNGVRWLQEQLDSILTQAKVAVTVFVSVDCSSDGTEKWIDEVASRDSRIFVLPHGQRFGGAARNFFRLIRDVDFADFDYVSFADQDDIWPPGKLSRAHEMLLSTGSDAYSSNVLAFWPNGLEVLIEKAQAPVQWDFLFEAAGPGCTYVMRKELAHAIQALAKAHWVDIQKVGLHDWFVYAFARANGYRWVIDDYAGMLYRQHEKNQVGVNSGARAFAQRASKVLNGWGLTQSALIAQLVGLGDDPFVKRWSGGSRAGLLWLGFHAWQCRRRVRDKIIFSLSCIALCLVGSRHQ